MQRAKFLWGSPKSAREGDFFPRIGGRCHLASILLSPPPFRSNKPCSVREEELGARAAGLAQQQQKKKNPSHGSGLNYTRLKSAPFQRGQSCQAENKSRRESRALDCHKIFDGVLNMLETRTEEVSSSLANMESATLNTALIVIMRVTKTPCTICSKIICFL